MKLFGSKRIRKKGTETPATALGILLIVIGIVALFYFIFPLVFGDIFKTISLSSAEIVARDIAGFISVSGVAPNEIKINYNPSESSKYNMIINDRVVQVFLDTEKIKTKEVATAKSATGGIDEKFDLVNIFEIRKSTISSIDQNEMKVFTNNFGVTAK
jgi:hypothetical protein